MDDFNKKAKESFDELTQLINSYTVSESYQQFLQFICKVRNYSPYNTALIYAQNPKVTYVASVRDWEERHQRVVAPHARPLIILAPFHPVMFVFDVEDTDGEPLPQRVYEPYWVDGRVRYDNYANLVKFCRKIDVRIEDISTSYFHAGQVRADFFGNQFQGFVIGVNAHHEIETQFVTLLHELAHLLCGHLSAPGDELTVGSLKQRAYLSHLVKEFEAESVAFIVCQRFGLKSNSEEYLADYLKKYPEIPAISIDTVLQVAGYLEAATKGELPLRFSKKAQNKKQQADEALKSHPANDRELSKV